MRPLAALGATMAVGFIAMRLCEAPDNPATLFRILTSALAISFFIFARRSSLLQRATVFLALEALGGVVAFSYVDLPFIMSHQKQIGSFAVTLYRDVDRSQERF